jgi:hypothetical protein
VDFLNAWNPDSGIGAAAVFVSQTTLNPAGGAPMLLNPGSVFVSHKSPVFKKGMSSLFFWVRWYVDYSMDWDRKELALIPAGTAYQANTLFYFYDVESEGAFDGAENLAEAVRDRRRGDILLGPHPFAPRR